MSNLGTPITRSRTGGADAVCFTSGPACAPFAAGVIHAWLAVDRLPPLVAAGISLGAVSAAAMQRVYEELESPSNVDLEQKRWEWFRRYLSDVTDNPIGAIWDSIPDPVDFYATTPPVKDLSVPDALYEESEDARRHYYILTRLGIWLSNLPVRVSTIANIVVSYVRLKEGYGRPSSAVTLWWNAYKAIAGIGWHLLRRPLPIVEAFFYQPRPGVKTDRHRSFMIRPLFGWIWGVCSFGAMTTVVSLAIFISGIRNSHFLYEHVTLAMSKSLTIHPTVIKAVAWLGSAVVGGSIAISIAAIASVVIPALFALLKAFRNGRSSGFGIVKLLIQPLDLTLALIKPYEAKRQLHDLFVSNARDKQQAAKPSVQLLVVCAALEAKEQICLNPAVPIVDALSAAIAIPGIFPPELFEADRVPEAVQAARKEIERLKNLSRLQHFSVIDGAAVRSNPIPAFFEWCKEDENRHTVLRLERKDPASHSLHVVYSVPIDYEGSVQDAPVPESLDIVESALLSLQLEKRRDTRQEVRQTNYTSQLQEIRQRVTGELSGKRGPFTIFADEIAPRHETGMGGGLQPDQAKLMCTVAAGCRATLETLYSKEIATAGHGSSVFCSALLTSNSGRRRPNSDGKVEGLPEVCGSCSGVLEYRSGSSKKVSNGVLQTYGDPGKEKKKDLAHAFKHLTGPDAKVVFLGSGGVFRGAFHIGVIAAMATVKLYPDLVVGSSVGALMGGALCNITIGSASNEIEVLEELVRLFVHVDSRVALTKTLKNATKQLGTRARGIELSPSELARMVQRGSQADAGYASTGAPPALIDALSYLFTLPHDKTVGIASEFIAGHIGKATMLFLQELRKETLVHFDIQSSVMGVSLLASQVEKLLAGKNPEVNLSAFQPFHKPGKGRKPVSFFCTTSFLNAKVALLLGRDFLTDDPTWNAVYAGLSSSAFPAVFAPRRESDFIPGRGRTDRYFGDGGMFDNLPFLPAIEILSAVQKSEAEAKTVRSIEEMSEKERKQYQDDVMSFVESRANTPNIFIAAGLDAPPAERGNYDTVFKIRKRASSLSVESKVNTFVHGSEKTVSDMKAIASAKPASLSNEDLAFLNQSVSAKVVCISPTDVDHINPTFAFCRATGLETAHLQRSIADGCFQSLIAFSDIERNPEVRKSLEILGTPVAIRTARRNERVATCPYYSMAGAEFTCPFSKSTDQDVSGVYEACRSDKAHRRKIKGIAK